MKPQRVQCTFDHKFSDAKTHHQHTFHVRPTESQVHAGALLLLQPQQLSGFEVFVRYLPGVHRTGGFELAARRVEMRAKSVLLLVRVSFATNTHVLPFSLSR